MTHIADKISALIAKAESSAHPDEADAFMAKVHQLLEREGLSLHQLGTLDHNDPIGETLDAGLYTPIESSFRDVAFAIALYYGCRAIIVTRHVEINGKYVKRYFINVYGRQNARTTFELMWGYIKRCMINEGSKLHKAQKQLLKETYGKLAPNPQSMSVHMRHVATALEIRVRRLVHERQVANAANTADANTANALVPVDQIEAIMPDAHEARATKKSTTRAAIRAAAGIGLELQTEAKRNTVKRLG